MTFKNRPTRTIARDAANAIANDLGWNARLAARALTTQLDEGLAPTGISSIQFGLMCLIASSPDDTVGGLAERAGLDQSTMSRNIDGLARLELAEVVIAIEDRRRRAVWLTEKGLRLLTRAMPVWRVVHEALAAQLDSRFSQQLSTARQVSK